MNHAIRHFDAARTAHTQLSSDANFNFNFKIFKWSLSVHGIHLKAPQLVLMWAAFEAHRQVCGGCGSHSSHSPCALSTRCFFPTARRGALHEGAPPPVLAC
jgi:hypothetical protein